MSIIARTAKVIQEADGHTERGSNRGHREQGVDISHHLKLDPFDRVVSTSSLEGVLESTPSAFCRLGAPRVPSTNVCIAYIVVKCYKL